MRIQFTPRLQLEPISGSAALAAGITAVATGADLYAKAKMNRKTRQWNEKMYQLQRENSISDWHMQNEYNSPQAQMQRYRDAGLNPALIYGQSNEGGVVRSTDAKAWNPEAPQASPGVQRSLSSYYDVQMREAQVNNLKAQNDNILAQKNLIEAQTLGVYKEIDNKESQIGSRQWALDSSKSLFPGSLEMQDLKIRSGMKDLDIKTQRHAYDLMLKSQSVQEGVFKILKAQQETQIQRLDMALKSGMITKQVYDRELTKQQWFNAQEQEKIMQEIKRNAEWQRLNPSQNNGDAMRAVDMLLQILGPRRFK